MSDREGDPSPERRPVFVGWEDPVGAAATILLDAARVAAGDADLSDARVVVPGGRARRQLLRALLAAAQERGLRLLPPILLLPHELELALRETAAEPIADEAVTVLAWAAALRSADERDREHLAPAGFPGLARRLRLARRLLDAHREIEAACVDVRDVAAAAERLGADGARYVALGRLAESARSLLAEHGLVDADAARDRALLRPPRAGGPVFLFATVDLAARARRALVGLGDRLSVLCAAPANCADRFDALGAVAPDAWLRRLEHVPLELIQVADGPLDQAEAVAARVVALAADGRLDPDRCAVVLADEELAEPVARELSAVGIAVHDARGIACRRLPPARVLEVVAAHLREPTTRTLRALVREPVVERTVVRRCGLAGPGAALAALDGWLEGHHDRPIPEDSIFAPQAAGDGRGADVARVLVDVERAVRALLRPLAARRALGAFESPLLALLAELFPDAPPADDRGVIDGALALVRAQLAAFAACPSSIQPEVEAADAIDAVLAVLASARVREEPRDDELDLVGWLELPFDPATDVVVVGANDGRVPAAPADPFLPDALRRATGLPDDRRRTARDAWILATALARGSATFVVGRRSAAGDPLVPSRLLTTGRGEELARRVLALTRSPVHGVSARRPQRSFGPPPAPSGGVALDRVRVTAFAAYLASPYRFWLEQVLRLDEREPAGDELDARGFGSVVHAVLEAWSRRPDAAALTDPDQIEQGVREELDAILHERAGPALSAGLRVQRRILQERLRWFAERQAQEARDGWRIRHVELQLDDPIEIPGDAPVTLVGKVDRVDYHEREQRWRVLDYKTSDKARSPDTAHCARDGRWRDLQLPLYQHLLGERLQAEAPGRIEVGYFNLAASRDAVGVVGATRLADMVDAAVDEARLILRRIRAGELPLPDESPAFESPGIAILCRTPALADDEEDDA